MVAAEMLAALLQASERVTTKAFAANLSSAIQVNNTNTTALTNSTCSALKGALSRNWRRLKATKDLWSLYKSCSSLVAPQIFAMVHKKETKLGMNGSSRNGVP